MAKRLHSSLLKLNRGDERLTRVMMEALARTIPDQDKEQVKRENRRVPDFPLLQNLKDLEKQGEICLGKDILPQWAMKQVREALKIAKSQAGTEKDRTDLLWFTYWTVKMACDRTVALAVAKIMARWHTGDSSGAFFQKLKEQQEKAIQHLKPLFTPDDPTSPVSDFYGQTPDATAWRRQLAPFDIPFDDRDASLDSESERTQGYGLPKEDFDKDCEQVAWLFGFPPSWRAYVYRFLWPQPESMFVEVPRNTVRVSTSDDGVTIIIPSQFISREYLFSSYMWERIKKALLARWWNYEELPSAKEMVQYLESNLNLNEMPSEVAQWCQPTQDDLNSTLSPEEFDAAVDSQVGIKDAHKSKRWRRSHRPILKK